MVVYVHRQIDIKDIFSIRKIDQKDKSFHSVSFIPCQFSEFSVTIVVSTKSMPRALPGMTNSK